MVKADVALAVLVLFTLRVGGGDPEQGLAVAPAGHVVVLMLELESEKAQHLVVKLLRAGEIADAENEMIDANNARHETLRLVARIERGEIREQVRSRLSL